MKRLGFGLWMLSILFIISGDLQDLGDLIGYLIGMVGVILFVRGTDETK